MTQNKFVYLVSRELSGEATPEEMAELKNSLKGSDLLMKKYSVFQKMRMQQEKDKQPDVEQALKKVRKQINEEDSGKWGKNKEGNNRKLTSLLRLTGIAAALIGFVIIIVVYATVKEKSGLVHPSGELLSVKSSSLVEKQNVKGTRSSIILSDGSKVWLNADSKLEYTAHFEGNTREVCLSGEAFFEVAKNPQKPFIIHLAKGVIRVLGTSFNVRAYDNEKVVETSVATGKVAFIPKYDSRKKGDTIFITPNNKVSFQFEKESVSVVPTIVTEDKAWTEGKLIFKARTLEEIAIDLGRAFDKKVVFLDDNAKGFVFTGSFQNNSLEEILYYLSLSKSNRFYYKITNEQLLISTEHDKF